MTVGINPGVHLPMMRPEAGGPSDMTRAVRAGSEASDGARSEASDGARFTEALGEFVNQVDEIQKVAEQQSVDFAEGRTDDIHGTMIALQRADVSLRLLGSVRNRALEAYREVMRMGA